MLRFLKIIRSVAGWPHLNLYSLIFRWVIKPQLVIIG
jgi:hypothetical protein